MNYTRGPWSIQLRSKSLGGQIGNLQYLSIDNDTGPVVIVDKHDHLVAAVVHRPGRAEGFSETASNARIIAYAPDLYEKAVNLIRNMRGGLDITESKEKLEQLLAHIEGAGVVPSPK